MTYFSYEQLFVIILIFSLHRLDILFSYSNLNLFEQSLVIVIFCVIRIDSSNPICEEKHYSNHATYQNLYFQNSLEINGRNSPYSFAIIFYNIEPQKTSWKIILK